MFSKFTRLGAALSAAMLLASCSSGSGQAETQQSTPEGLFVGTVGVSFTNSLGTTTSSTHNVAGVPPYCTQNTLMFVNYAGVFYMFNTVAPDPSNPNHIVVVSASSGNMSYSGGSMGSSNVLEVVPPNTINSTSGAGYYTLPWNNDKIQAPNGTNCGIPITYYNEQLNVEYPTSPTSSTYSAPAVVSQVNNSTTSPTFTGAYNTGVNIGGTFTYQTQVDSLVTGAVGDFKTSNLTGPNSSLSYSTEYQGVQDLGTLAGTYVGTVATSQFSEPATFTFGPASVPANSGNAFGVGLVSGTGASGCTYNGTVSPLFKGNGYNMVINSGPPPCVLPNSQFTGLVFYSGTRSPQLYSFSTLGTRTDGVIFTGSRH